jgi:hydrogenase-4 component E
MTLNQLSLDQQAVLMLAALVLFTAFAMLAQRNLFTIISIFAWQGLLLALTTALVANISDQGHLYFSALLTAALKAFFIPWLLRRLVARLGLTREAEPAFNITVILLIAAALVVFSYYIVLPVEALATDLTRNTIAVGLAVLLLGMLMLITRRKAINQVIGFMTMENGLFFTAVAATYGMPMVVELGIAFDVLVAAVLFGVFFFQIRSSIDSLDVDRLNRLSEEEQ